jgi:copper transport protein
MRWLLLAFALGAVAFFTREPSTPADAHALLVKADPPVNSQLRDPPKELTLYFSEPLERKFSSVRVIDQDGNRVDQSVTFDDTDKALMRVQLSDLKPGYITVNWQTVSAVDGHHITGSYPITILNQNGSVAATPPAATSSVAGDQADPVRVVTKAAILIAASLLVGALVFLSLITPAESSTEARAGFERRVLTVLAMAFVALALAGGVDLLFQAVDINTSVSQVLKTQWGERWWWRHLVLIQPALLIPIMFRSQNARRGLAMGALVGAACYLAIASSTSHGAAGGGAFWATASDFVHLLGACVWIGMLAILALHFFWARQALTGQARYEAQAGALRRFSLIAVVSVTLILFTGVINAIIEVGSFGDLFNTGYGEVLLLKLLLLVPLLAIGGRNAYLLRPQIVQEAAERSTEQRREFLRELETELNKTIRWELGVAVAVLAVVAVLVQLTPTRGRVEVPEQSGKYVLTADAEDIFVTLTIDPNQPGSNTFEVYLAGATDTVENLRLEFVQPGGFASPSRLALDASNPPTFFIGQGPYLTAPGNWTITLNIRRNVGFDLRLDFQDDVKAAAAPVSNARVGGSFDSPIAFSLNVSLLLGVTAAGTLILLLGSLPRPGYPDGYLAWAVEEATYRLPVMRLRPLISLGVLIAVGIGLGIIVGAHTHSRLSQSAATAGNPIPATKDSIDKGRVLFMNNCTKCHGESGRGDGPLAASLPIPPANLYDHIPYHPDQFFFGVMTKGLGGVMPAFENVLSETDRWNILNFLRDQFGTATPAAQ